MACAATLLWEFEMVLGFDAFHCRIEDVDVRLEGWLVQCFDGNFVRMVEVVTAGGELEKDGAGRHGWSGSRWHWVLRVEKLC
jgi:hypothetical protein